MFQNVGQAKRIADQQRTIFRQAKERGDTHTMRAAQKKHNEATAYLREQGWGN